MPLAYRNDERVGSPIDIDKLDLFTAVAQAPGSGSKVFMYIKSGRESFIIRAVLPNRPSAFSHVFPVSEDLQPYLTQLPLELVFFFGSHCVLVENWVFGLKYCCRVSVKKSLLLSVF